MIDAKFEAIDDVKHVGLLLVAFRKAFSVVDHTHHFVEIKTV